MTLYQELLAHQWANEAARLLSETPKDVISDVCYRTLSKIRDILSDETLSDETCFHKIEAIVCALEEQGITCGGRHDFG